MRDDRMPNLHDERLHDELDIPMPSMAPAQPAYRMASRRPVVDPMTKRLAIIGGGLAGALLLIAGAWAVMGHQGARQVPVIQADARPLRTKPVDSGGMQVTGEDDAILSGEADGKDSMMPPPETPEPQTLKAEEKAAAKAAPVAPAAVASSAAKPAPVAAAAPAHAATVAEAAPAAPPVPAAAEKTRLPLSALGGHTQVQLAALDTEAAALSEWHRLSHRMPTLLEGRAPVVQKTEHDGRTFFRLRTGGFTDIAQATAFCQQVRAKGGGCSLATF